MRSPPDPATCFAKSIHSDAVKTFDRIEQARHDEVKTGLVAGVMRARQAEAFRKEKVTQSGERMSRTGGVVTGRRVVGKDAS